MKLSASWCHTLFIIIKTLSYSYILVSYHRAKSALMPALSHQSVSTVLGILLPNQVLRDMAVNPTVESFKKIFVSYA
ncbi:hypothetical protein EDC48_101324 [Gibbsiella quercinecans]|nr:hypothetical protein EDC48_101324 [Gibbsiella quercinecans]